MPLRRLIVPLALAFSLLFVTSAHAYVYWADFGSGTIGRANVDGTNVEDGFIATGGHPIAVAVTSSRIYWANESTGTIGRANLDGSAVEPSFISGINKPHGVAVSPTAIFWPSLGGNEIGKANLDGTGKNLALVTGVGAPCSIAIDSGHVYWGTAELTAFLGRASLTGTSPEREWVNLGTYVPCGLATNSANIFFADTGSFGPAHEIGRANIKDGSGLDKSIIGEAEGPCGLTVFGGKLYWANDATNTIGVANTDATGVNESLVQTGGNQICGVAVDSLSSPLNPPPSGGGGSGESSSPPPSPAPSPPTPGTIRLLKLKPDAKHGTAQLKVEVDEAGVVSLAGKGIAPAKATARGAGPVTLSVRATKAKAATLAQTGKLASKLTVTFVPANGGATASLARSLTLHKSLTH